MDDKERLRHLLKILSFDSNDSNNYKSTGKSSIDDFIETHSISNILDSNDSNNYKPTEKLTIDDLIQNHGISNILDHIGEDKIQDYLRIKKINKINRRN